MIIAGTGLREAGSRSDVGMGRRTRPRKGARLPKRRIGRRRRPSRPSRRGPRGVAVRPPAGASRLPLDRWLHPQAPVDPPWRHLPLVLVAAFVVRAAIALAGDFVLHPDEIMQYLEPAHRLAFGNGVIYWEYFYGARSWFVPGAIAWMLKVFDLAGAAEPAWYIAGVKLGFCAVSLVIPAGMYFFARQHFGERSARAALVAGSLWYELAGFAHKPMTEFVATAFLLALLAVVIRPAAHASRCAWQVAVLAVLASAIRVQYAPLALALLAVLALRTKRRAHLVAAAAACALAIGAFDAVTWDGGLFHSYITNVRFNLVLAEFRVGESPAYQYLEWLLLAGGGLSAVVVGAAAFYPRRYGFLLALTALAVVTHSLQAHKEYRFVFAVIPIWLLIATDVWARIASGSRGRQLGVLAAFAFVAASIAGFANALPGQNSVYRAWSRESGTVAFVRNQDPIFAAYRYLAGAPEVKAVWQVDRPYFNLPGYYYLHQDIPFYDQNTGRLIGTDAAEIRATVSHIVSGDPATSVPGYSVEREFGGIRILRRDENGGDVRNWEARTPTIVADAVERIMEQVASSPPSPPENSGIRFVGPGQSHGAPP